jgi:hypothetical protein
MKKIYLIAITLILVGSLNTQAQLKLGIKAGPSFPSLNETDGNFDITNNTGWHAGGMLEIKLPIVGIQGDIIYSQTSADVVDANNVQSTIKSATVDIPVVAKLYLLKIITIQAGPQFAFLTSSTWDDQDIKDNMSISNIRFVAGLGVSLGPIDVHGRFIFPSKTEFADLGSEVKNSNIQLSVGWWLKK